MSELHIKNHYVPECYLKNWEDAQEKICVYRTLVSHKNVPIWKKFTRSAIAYHKHLYTLVISGEETDDLETWLDREYETPATFVIEKAVNDKRLSPDDWRVLIRFLASQDVRTPARLYEHLQRNSKLLPEIVENTLSVLKEKLESNDSSSINENVPALNKSIQIPLKISREHVAGEKDVTIKAETYVGRATWLFSIRHLLENTAKVLHEHKWSIIKPAKGYSWNTSDNPVIKLNFINPQNYDLTGGWGKTKGNIIFPIGPEHAMFVQIGDRPIPRGTRLSVYQTEQFRKLIAENSDRMIFSNSFDNELERYKPRVVDSDTYLSEKTELNLWHERNKELEMEYFK